MITVLVVLIVIWTCLYVIHGVLKDIEKNTRAIEGILRREERRQQAKR